MNKVSESYFYVDFVDLDVDVFDVGSDVSRKVVFRQVEVLEGVVHVAGSSGIQGLVGLKNIFFFKKFIWKIISRKRSAR